MMAGEHAGKKANSRWPVICFDPQCESRGNGFANHAQHGLFRVFIAEAQISAQRIAKTEGNDHGDHRSAGATRNPPSLNQVVRNMLRAIGAIGRHFLKGWRNFCGEHLLPKIQPVNTARAMPQVETEDDIRRSAGKRWPRTERKQSILRRNS